MKTVRFWTDSIDQWSNKPYGFEHLPIEDFLANGVKEGFFLIRVHSKAVSSSKSLMGHSRFPLQKTADAAVRVTLQQLREMGRGGEVYAFKMPDGTYEYHKS